MFVPIGGINQCPVQSDKTLMDLLYAEVGQYDQSVEWHFAGSTDLNLIEDELDDMAAPGTEYAFSNNDDDRMIFIVVHDGHVKTSWII